jgi:hypothetical protein
VEYHRQHGLLFLDKTRNGVVLYFIRNEQPLPELPVACFYHVYAKEEIGNSMRKYGHEQASCVIQDQAIGYTRHNSGQPEIVLQTKEDRRNHK